MTLLPSTSTRLHGSLYPSPQKRPEEDTVSEPRATNSQPAACAFAYRYLNVIARGPMNSVIFVLGGAAPTTERTRLLTLAQGSRSASGTESPAVAHEP